MKLHNKSSSQLFVNGNVPLGGWIHLYCFEKKLDCISKLGILHFSLVVRIAAYDSE